MKASEVLYWDGRTSRGTYLVTGIILFALKYNIDRVIAEGVFGRKWSYRTYLLPFGGLHGEIMSPDDSRFYAYLILVALPFIWMGVTLTLRRLHDAGLPPWLVVLFFCPLVNLVFFCVLSIIPARDEVAPSRGASVLHKILPQSQWGSAAMAVFLVVPPAVCLAWGGAELLRDYGVALFVGLPFAVGMASALLYSYHAPRTLGQCVLVSFMSICLVGLGIFIIAMEGIICLAMAFPIGATLGVMGGIVGYLIQKRYWARVAIPNIVIMLLCVMPLLMGAEHATGVSPPLLAVTSAVDIEASPEVVWQNVVSFAPLPEPKELVFQTGIAYPQRAVIKGTGRGAVRYCAFTTGSFVEPIDVWDPPHRLSFSVASQPEPMQEWSFYHDLQAAHLDNYLVSERGEFRLTALAGGRTHLEGTTWYRHRIWPVAYWRPFSDGIIHAIHMRVMRHIKSLSEATHSPAP
jgi:uncharacterized membrane protein YhaH (DUF805 family)